MRIFPLGLSLFILIPIIEIYLFIKVGGLIGAFPTILLILTTAVIGLALLRKQGLTTLQQVQGQMQAGELPAASLIEGMLLFFAGALLLTPGFFTDAIGFLLMIPLLRKKIALWLLEHSGWIVQVQSQGHYQRYEQKHSHTLEGEYKRRDE